MPDITMCDGDDCPMKHTCWRYEAPPTPGRQSYFAAPPYKTDDDGNVTCEYFSPMEDNDAKRG